MRVAEAVGINLAQDIWIVHLRELVRRRDGVVAQALTAVRHRWASGIDAKDRRHGRIQALRLQGIARVRTTAVRETMIGAAGIEKAIVLIAGLRERIEFDGTHRVSKFATTW